MADGTSETPLDKVNKVSVLHRWWQRLILDHGAVARFRRCRALEEVYMQPEFSSLIRDMPDRGGTDQLRDKLAAACVALSHVKADSSRKKFGHQLGSVLSGAKSGQTYFRRLYEISDNDPEKLVLTLNRFVRRLDGMANIEDLARTILYWPKMRKHLAMDFFESFKG